MSSLCCISPHSDYFSFPSQRMKNSFNFNSFFFTRFSRLANSTALSGFSWLSAKIIVLYPLVRGHLFIWKQIKKRREEGQRMTIKRMVKEFIIEKITRRTFWHHLSCVCLSLSLTLRFFVNYSNQKFGSLCSNGFLVSFLNALGECQER